MKIVDKREEHWQVEHLQTKLRLSIAQCVDGGQLMTRSQAKCPYCDFQGEDQIGMEINSEKRLSEDQMMSVDWEDGYWFNYLRRRNRDQVTLVSLHTDNEFYSFDIDEVEIEYCPKCGRKL